MTTCSLGRRFKNGTSISIQKQSGYFGSIGSNIQIVRGRARQNCTSDARHSLAVAGLRHSLALNGFWDTMKRAQTFTRRRSCVDPFCTSIRDNWKKQVPPLVKCSRRKRIGEGAPMRTTGFCNSTFTRRMKSRCATAEQRAWPTSCDKRAMRGKPAKLVWRAPREQKASR